MIVLICGGSGSGKSAFAEEMTASLCMGMEMYYIATMHVYDAEGQAKVERHRSQRQGKGFMTVEIEKNAACICDFAKNSGALLESISNLAANEMFYDAGIRSANDTVSKVCKGLEHLCSKLKHLVIVTDNIFEDGDRYAPSMLEYMTALGKVNQFAARIADEVWEVVCGIPVRIK